MEILRDPDAVSGGKRKLKWQEEKISQVKVGAFIQRFSSPIVFPVILAFSCSYLLFQVSKDASNGGMNCSYPNNVLESQKILNILQATWFRQIKINCYLQLENIAQLFQYIVENVNWPPTNITKLPSVVNPTDAAPQFL